MDTDLSKSAFFDRPICTALAENKSTIYFRCGEGGGWPVCQYLPRTFPSRKLPEGIFGTGKPKGSSFAKTGARKERLVNLPSQVFPRGTGILCGQEGKMEILDKPTRKLMRIQTLVLTMLVFSSRRGTSQQQANPAGKSHLQNHAGSLRTALTRRVVTGKDSTGKAIISNNGARRTLTSTVMSNRIRIVERQRVMRTPMKEIWSFAVIRVS